MAERVISFPIVGNDSNKNFKDYITKNRKMANKKEVEVETEDCQCCQRQETLQYLQSTVDALNNIESAVAELRE